MITSLAVEKITSKLLSVRFSKLSKAAGPTGDFDQSPVRVARFAGAVSGIHRSFAPDASPKTQPASDRVAQDDRGM